MKRPSRIHPGVWLLKGVLADRLLNSTLKSIFGLIFAAMAKAAGVLRLATKAKIKFLHACRVLLIRSEGNQHSGRESQCALCRFQVFASA